jgi:hypothetical protein
LQDRLPNLVTFGRNQRGTVAMVDDSPEDMAPSPDQGRPRRAPPTIDLDASEVSGETRNAAGEPPGSGSGTGPGSGSGAGSGSGPEQVTDQAPGPTPEAPKAPVSPWVIAVISGAVAASLVIAVAWVLGWPAVPDTPAAPQVSAAVVDGLTARIAGLESKISKPAATDPAAAARLDALEKSLFPLRGELTGLRAQSEKLAAAVNDVKSAPREGAAPLDLSAINERIAQIERTTRTQNSEIAQENAKPADDLPLRRIVAAALLDVLVRIGDPYATALAAVRALTDHADGLKPLDSFADKGVPNPAALSRELLTLVPKLSPPMPENPTAGLVDRLQAGAAKLVRIERTDGVGTDRGAIVARVTAAALRNEYAEARRELKTLEPADRAAAQAWIEKADARDAALAASRQFAAEAMTALVKPAP